MPQPARATIRCLVEDLKSGWVDPAERRMLLDGQLPSKPLHQLQHPALSHLVDVFPVGDVEAERESISGLSNPPWWRLKGSRWRGAVYIDEDGQAWLCAAGLRRDDSGSDFYKQFMAEIESKGPEYFLPTDEDKDRLRLEVADIDLRDWEVSVYSETLRIVAEAARTGRSRGQLSVFSGLGDDVPASLDVSVDTLGTPWDSSNAHESPAEVALQITINNWQDPEALSHLQTVVCRAISPREEDWSAVPEHSFGIRLICTISEARVKQLVVANELPESPNESATLPAQMSPVSHAHYAPRKEIAAASVEGRAVRGLCGTWFVPRQDHVELPVCDVCDTEWSSA